MASGAFHLDLPGVGFSEGHFGELGGKPSLDVNMRDPEEDESCSSDEELDIEEEASMQEEPGSQQEDATEEKTLASGSPPKLINTPPTNLPNKPTLIGSIRRSQSMINPTLFLASESEGTQWKTSRAEIQGLEDGRHIGVKGPLTLFGGPPADLPVRTPTLGRSRSLPDFMEVEGHHVVEGVEWHKKSQKSSGNSSPRSAMRDWDEDSPSHSQIALMLPSPRDELRSFLVAHQAADSKVPYPGYPGGSLIMTGSAPLERNLVERSRKRPSTDPGTSRVEHESMLSTSEDVDHATSMEIATAFKAFVRF